MPFRGTSLVGRAAPGAPVGLTGPEPNVVLVHGAFDELWGPHEIASRWLPGPRYGLWHHGCKIDDDDVRVCFYGDLFRQRPGWEAAARVEQSRVVVAHSLGCVLTYIALCNHPSWPVHTFVTLGPPLASPVTDGLVGPPVSDGIGAWPGSVQRWVNVRAVVDAAAARPPADRFAPRVEDVLVDNGHRAHAPEPYLNADVTGAAVAAALGVDPITQAPS